METRFTELRQELQELGYHQPLVLEAVPLTDKLVNDLKTTTESLRKYMRIATQAIEERDSLQLGAEPYKCDNAKLIKECNELHLAFIQFKEQHEKVKRDLNREIATLKNESTQRLALNKPIKTKKVADKIKTSRDQENINAMAVADEKVTFLTEEVKKLKEQQLQLIENNDYCQQQLKNREKEIKRLSSLVEGKRPSNVLNSECCYRNVDRKVGTMQDDVNNIKRENNSLQCSLKEALAKQHEAMRRALHLAERNKQLEKELKDIDRIALAVEADCNNTVKDNADKVTRLQDRMNESIILIQNLKRENSRYKLDKLELNADLDAVKIEKQNLQALLETEIDNKRRLNDQINSFSIIEHDLNMEIDRLVRLTSELKRAMAEQDSQITAGKLYKNSFSKQTRETKSKSKPTASRKTSKQISKHSKESFDKGTQAVRDTTDRFVPEDEVEVELTNVKCCKDCIKQFKELLDRVMMDRENQTMEAIESLREEKDYYMKEYQKFMEQLKSKPYSSNKLEEYERKLAEKEQLISDLQNEMQILRQEKLSLVSRLENIRVPEVDMGDKCNKLVCKRKEREIEILKEEITHLQQESETIKSKAQAINESSATDNAKIRRAFQDLEEQVHKLEAEKRELMQGQCSRRSTITHLEEQYDSLKEQFRATQNELCSQKANYNQLKNINEQSDRSLSDAQAQLLQVENELANLKQKLSTTSRQSSAQENEVASLNNDMKLLKSQLSKIDREKDDILNKLDEKTEKIALLEEQLQLKNQSIAKLEDEVNGFKKKLNKFSDDNLQQDQTIRSSRSQLSTLQDRLDTERQAKEAAVLENRRLQDEISSVTCDNRDARNELEIAKRQVEDLKRQLQHYVAEVKRTEDLISQKELERNEILDHFKSLSQEANVLESNNHTLESEATQSRVQLSVALDHATELEERLDNSNEICKTYERQITELTNQVASLEIQLKHDTKKHNCVLSELNQMRDLCVKLDKEKDSLRRELIDKTDGRTQVNKSMERLNKERDSLHSAISKERNNIDGLEKLLNEARQEVIEQRLLNQDLQSEVNRLKIKIEDLQERLSTTSIQLDTFQEKALEYSQQNKQLRREYANERFSHTHRDDVRYPSL